MTTAFLAPILLFGQLATAHGNHVAARETAHSAVCGADVSALARAIERLQTARFDLARYQAVLALRHYEIACHPEIVTALIAALQQDHEDAVRAEAAISLAKLGADRPEVIEALKQAAATDRFTVRLRANWSLKVLAKRRQP